MSGARPDGPVEGSAPEQVRLTDRIEMQTVVFLAVVGSRFFVPLLIPRFPLPALVAALVIDGVDQSIFQAFGYDPPGYQSYDKAMDVYYLAVAYLSTLRNWTSRPAFRVAQFLYFYRLVGVVAFELTQWRTLLLVFANTFEYFFIAYELVRLRRDPSRYSLRFWVVTAAAIWVFVKLPQEWWIHVAQLDFTDQLALHPALGRFIFAVLVVAAAAFWWLVRPRLSPPDWPLRIAADPVPAQVATWQQRGAWLAVHGRLLSTATLEKVVLVGLISIIYAEVLPDLDATVTGVFAGLAVLVLANAAVTLALARGGRGTNRALLAFGLRVVVNLAVVLVARALLGARGIDLGAALFFVAMLSLLTLLDDWYRPVQAARMAEAGEGPQVSEASAS
jgi:hypothetical protein